METIAFYLLLALLSLAPSAEAMTVESATYDVSSDIIKVNVGYPGCHDVDLKLRAPIGCRESFPVQCDYEVVPTESAGSCEMWVKDSLLIDVKEAGFTDPYFEGARLTFFGDDESRASLSLPRR